MKRNLIGLIVLVVIIVLLIVLPRFIQDDRGKGKTLVVSSRLWSQPYEREYLLNEVIPPFEKENRCKVKFEVFDDEKLLQRMEVQQKTGNVNTDVIIVYVSKMPEWVKTGYLLDLTEKVIKWQGRTFMKSFQKMTAFDGKQYFLPIGADDYLLCANKRALKYLPKGVDFQKITWKQLISWSDVVAEKEGEGKFAVTGVPQKMLIYQIGSAILAYGGDFPDIGSNNAIKAWQELVKLHKALTATVQTYDSVIPPMKRGEAWITVTHNARVGEIYSSNPAQIVVAPTPVGPAGRGSVVGVSGLAVVKKAENRELALKFLEFLTRPDIQLKLAYGTGGFIPTVSESLQLLGKSTKDEVINKSMMVLKEGKLAYIPPCQDWGAVKLLFDDAFRKQVILDGKCDVPSLKSDQKALDLLLKN